LLIQLPFEIVLGEGQVQLPLVRVKLVFKQVVQAVCDEQTEQLGPHAEQIPLVVMNFPAEQVQVPVLDATKVVSLQVRQFIAVETHV